MYQAIHYDDHGPMTDPCRYLRRHDLVYRRPALRPYDGVPVGTGDAGGLLYQTAYGLELTVNHADALDYAPDGAMQAWAWEAEERQTAPVSCGHLSIRSTLPIFDWVYLEAFEQRLILSTASIEGRAKTPFAEASWSCMRRVSRMFWFWSWRLSRPRRLHWKFRSINGPVQASSTTMSRFWISTIKTCTASVRRPIGTRCSSRRHFAAAARRWPYPAAGSRSS